jgi:hypothetical protein
VAVGVGEVAAAAAPDRILSRFYDLGAGGFRGRQDFCDVFLLANVVREGDASKSGAARVDRRVFGQ